MDDFVMLRCGDRCEHIRTLKFGHQLLPEDYMGGLYEWHPDSESSSRRGQVTKGRYKFDEATSFL